MQVFRFTDFSGATVRLDLNDDNGWKLGQGLHLGDRTLERVYLQQPPFNGAVLASYHAPIVRMQIPLWLMRQTNAAAIRAKVDALITELNRSTNTIEFREPGDTVSYLIDTIRADVPTIHRALRTPNPVLFGGASITLEIDRQPDMRGAGAMI